MTKKNDAAIVRRGTNALAVRTDFPEELIVPATDIFETPTSFVVRMDLPGAVRESIQVNVQPERLSIRATVRSPHQDSTNLIHHEIPAKSYFRAFNLTVGVVSDRIEAEFQDGVLSVKIPKSDRFMTKEIRIQ
jgi:HSP20 family molecular chaperone IbpA